MADVQERLKKYRPNQRNPARISEHHLLYKELIPYFDWLHNMGLSNPPSYLSIPQSDLSLPISSSTSHRAIFAPLELRYIAPPSLASSNSSSRRTDTHSNVRNVNQVSNANVSADGDGGSERDSLPSDALRNLYRLAERVYSHLNLVVDEKANQTNSGTGIYGQNRKSIGNKPIEDVAPPAAREGSVVAPGRYSTETQHDLGARGFGTRAQYAPSISDSVSSLYSQDSLGTSTLIGENDSFYVSGHDRDTNNTKLAALSAALEKAHTQLAHERTAREEAESVIGALRGEVGQLTGKLERADAELDAVRQRELELRAQHKALNESINGLRSHMVSSEPAWAAALRAEVLASVKDLSSTTAHSFTGITKDLKHQHHEITQLSERTSTIAKSHEAALREAAHGVQRHLSEKLDGVTTEIASDHKKSMSAIASVEHGMKKEIPALSTVVMEVRTVVGAFDGRLAEHETASTHRHADLKKVLHQTTETLSTNHAQTGKLIHGINDKLQQHITASAETAYSNVATRSKTAAGDDDEELQPGRTMVAVEALKTLCSTSMTSIREAIERQQHDISTLLSQASSQSEQREIITKSGDQTTSRLEELDTKLSLADNNNAQMLATLEKMQEKLTSIAAGAWIEQSLENTGVSKKEDLAGITHTLHQISTQLHNLSGDGDASSLTLVDLMAQLSDLSARLANVEAEVQGAATATVVLEEISTIKSVRSLEHQADMAAGERMREAVLGLDEFVRGQLDQVNAALDEQQSRLVSLQAIGKQQSEDTKAISLIVEENGELLRSIETQGSQGHKASYNSVNGVSIVLEEIKDHVAALRETESSRVQTLNDTPPPVNDDIKELRKSMQEHHGLLQALPQRVHADSADRHDTLLARNVEVIALLKGLTDALSQLSKDTNGLKGAVAKVDSDLAGECAASSNRSKASEQMGSSVKQSIEALGREIAAIRERLISLPTSNGTPDAATSEQSATLLAKLEIIVSKLSSMKTTLDGDISGVRTQSESETQLLSASIEELKRILEKQSEMPDQDVVALRSVIEKHNTDLVSLRDQMSSDHSTSSVKVTNQLQELTSLVQGISFAEVLGQLKELGVSVTDIRGLIVEESKSSGTSYATLSAMHKILGSQSDQFSLLLKNDEAHVGRHDAVVSLLDRNHTKICDVYESVQSSSSSSKDTVSEHHTALMATLERILNGLSAHDTSSKEHHMEILKVSKGSQQYLSERSEKRESEINSKLSDLSKSFIELLSSHTFDSQSLRESITHLGDSNSNLGSKLDKRFNETVDILNQRFDSLRQEMTKEPALVRTLLVTLQERIGSMRTENEHRQQALAETLKEDLSMLHRDMEPLNTIVAKSQENGRLIYVAEESKDGKHHQQLDMDDQIHRMERLQSSLEGLVFNHHCNGCNCRGGYDSSQASPMKQRRNLSQFGSDATGLSPHPYVEQSFDVPSPADVRKEMTTTGAPAKPYSVDELLLPEDIVVQSPIGNADPETVDSDGKRAQFSFPRPHSRSVSSGGDQSLNAPAASGGAAAGATKKEKEHHHKHHDDREISNPFELFSRRPRKSSHRPDGPEDSQDSAGQQRPRVKSSTSAPMRSSIGSGKSQRGSLLSSALLNTVSDNPIPTVDARKRTSSGGLHRLSSIFGKHHHHHEDEAHAAGASGSSSKAHEAKKKEGTISHEHEHEDTTKKQEKEGKEGSA